MRLRSHNVVLPADLSAPWEGGLKVGPADVIVEGSHITEVIEWTTPPPQPPDEDLGRALLTPAFVNAHTHLSLVGLRGLDIGRFTAGNVVEDLFFRIERQMSPEDVAALARLGALESLLHGVGMVWDHYYHATAIAEACSEVGLCGVISPALQDLSGPGAHAWEASLQETETLHNTLRLRGKGLVTALGPHATDTVSDRLFFRIADTAERLNLPVHLHVAQSLAEVRRVMERTGGQRPMEHLNDLGILKAGAHWLMVHCLFVTPSDLRALDPDRSTLGYCPYSQQLFAFPASIEDWQTAGVPWLVATDCAATNDGMGVQKELRHVAGLRTHHLTKTSAFARWRTEGSLDAAIEVQEDREEAWANTASLGDPTFLLDRVWRVPGRMHPLAPCGVIAPGTLANLALWDLTHPAFWPGSDPLRALALSEVSPALLQMMTAGEWIGQRGDYARALTTSPNARRWIAEASERLVALLERC